MVRDVQSYVPKTYFFFGEKLYPMVEDPPLPSPPPKGTPSNSRKPSLVTDHSLCAVTARGHHGVRVVRLKMTFFPSLDITRRLDANRPFRALREKNNFKRKDKIGFRCDEGYFSAQVGAFPSP